MRTSTIWSRELFERHDASEQPLRFQTRRSSQDRERRRSHCGLHRHRFRRGLHSIRPRHMGFNRRIADRLRIDRGEKIFDRKDASQIVVDEVFGQIISFVFIAPYLSGLGANWRWWMIAGFALFRAFDIFKPYPINRLQGLPGGLGVMMDDALAGVYAAVVLSLLLKLVV